MATLKDVEKLQERVFELRVKVEVLEKMLDRSLEALAKSAVAEKTADKALAMAQEALTLMMNQSPSQETNTIMDELAGMVDPFSTPSKFPEIKNGMSDLELSKKLNMEVDQINEAMEGESEDESI